MSESSKRTEGNLSRACLLSPRRQQIYWITKRFRNNWPDKKNMLTLTRCRWSARRWKGMSWRSTCRWDTKRSLLPKLPSSPNSRMRWVLSKRSWKESRWDRWNQESKSTTSYCRGIKMWRRSWKTSRIWKESSSRNNSTGPKLPQKVMPQASALLLKSPSKVQECQTEIMLRLPSPLTDESQFYDLKQET